MISWVQQKKVGLLEYEEPTDCCANADGSNYAMHALTDWEWSESMQLDAVLRPFGPYLATMEATSFPTISLVLPMTGHLVKALDESTPVMLYDYEDPSKPIPIKMKVRTNSTSLYIVNIVDVRSCVFRAKNCVTWHGRLAKFYMTKLIDVSTSWSEKGIWRIC